MLQVLRSAILWLLLSSPIIRAQFVDNGPGPTAAATTVAASAHQASSSPGTGTCISRTVNYITHTLPQQCLRTDRSIPTAANVITTTSSNAQSETLGSTSSSSSESTNAATSSTASNETSSTVPEGSTSVADEGALVTSASPPLPVATIEPEPEEDSPLDNAHFLSFEEWKKQNLAKVGQSPEHIGQEGLAPRDRQRPGINNALDSLGEESEIDLDFSGFGGARAVSSESTQSSETSSETSLQSTPPNTPTLRSKDAGKTCKERTNYASFDCAAAIMKSNPECKSSSSILVENKDSYMLNVCSAQNKFFIVELCNDILIDTIVLANYEFFSSVFRHFRVSVADRYPVKPDKWKELGTFEARNTREVQAFLVENPLIWARYLRIEFLSHYGNEYYCPLSLLRVHGTTMMEEFRHQEELARGEVAEDEPVLESEVPPTTIVQQEPLMSTDETVLSTVEVIPPVQTEPVTSSSALDTSASSIASTPEATSEIAQQNCNDAASAIVQTHEEPDASISTSDNDVQHPETIESSTSRTTPSLGHQDPPASISQIVNTIANTSPSARTPSESQSIANDSLPSRNTSAPISTIETTKMEANDSQASPALSMTSTVHEPGSNTSLPQSASISTQAAVDATEIRTNSTKASTATSIAAHPPQPTTQESFFKSVSKRLQQLESNSTLSLQYIEEQSRILRDAFTKVEKRQVAATEKFLTHLNDTVMGELHNFQQAYDQLWQSTVIELDGQREQYQREMLALSSRLTLVADELVWQKRMGIVQSTLLLLCLGLVLFARQGNGYLEMPLAQQLMHKSQAAFRTTGWDSEPGSPNSPGSRSPVSLLRRRIWRTKSEADVTSGHATDVESREDVVRVEPPSPTLDVDEDEGDEDDEDESVYEEPKGSVGMQSGPATPNGRAEGLKRLPGDVGVLAEAAARDDDHV